MFLADSRKLVSQCRNSLFRTLQNLFPRKEVVGIPSRGHVGRRGHRVEGLELCRRRTLRPQKTAHLEISAAGMQREDLKCERPALPGALHQCRSIILRCQSRGQVREV